MSPTISDLGQKVKVKYPGQYDDMPDDEVGRRVKAKFPGSYDDFADAPAVPASQAFVKPEGSSAGRAAGGFLKNTVGGLVQGGKMAADLAKTYLSGQVLPSQETQQNLAGIYEGSKDQAKQAGEAYKQGHYSEAVGHGLATVPVIGPPAAAAADRIAGSGERPQLDRFGNVVKQELAPDVAGGVGEAAGLVAAAAPGGIAKAAGKIAGKVPIPERLTPEGMYQSSLRPSLAKKNLPKIQKQVQTGLNERIPVDRSGLNKTRSAIDATNEEIADRLRTKSDELGPVVSPKAVAQRIEDVRPTFEEQVNPEPDVTALNRSRDQFLKKHSTEAPFTKVRPGTEEAEGTFVPEGAGSTPVEKPLTLSEAQAEKVGTYRQLRKKYGELGSADVEAQKSLARGLKEEIVKRVPELTELNAKDGALIELEGQLEKMVAREGNKNILGLVPATMSHNPFGFIATLMMDNPAIKSRIAIALHRARSLKGPSSSAVAPIVSGTAMAGNASRPDLQAPPPIR